MEKKKETEITYKFEVGEFVFNEYDLKEVKSIDKNGKPDILDDGYSNLTSNSTNSFPITIKNKRIVDAFKLFYDRLSRAKNQKSFNWPEIHKYFVGLFDKACFLSEFDIDHSLPHSECQRDVIEKGEIFVAKVFEAMETIEQVTVAGIKILK